MRSPILPENHHRSGGCQDPDGPLLRPDGASTPALNSVGDEGLPLLLFNREGDIEGSGIEIKGDDKPAQNFTRNSENCCLVKIGISGGG